MKFAVAFFSLSLRAYATITQQFEMYGAKTLEDLKTFESWGITQVIIDPPELLEKADNLGFRVVQPNWFNKDTAWATIRLQAERASKFKNLVSMNLVDEPIFNGLSNHPVEFYESVQPKIKELFPSVSLSLTEHGPSPSWSQSKIQAFQKFLNFIDRIRIDPYPVIGGRPLSEVYEWQKLTKSLIAGRPIPITTILQTWTSNPNTPSLPTLNELRVMAYQVLLMEAEALSFFDFNPAVWAKVPGFTSGFANLLHELRDFSRKFQDCSVKTTLHSQKILQSDLNCPSGDRYQVRVNTNPCSMNHLPPYEVRISSLP